MSHHGGAPCALIVAEIRAVDVMTGKCKRYCFSNLRVAGQGPGARGGRRRRRRFRHAEWIFMTTRYARRRAQDRGRARGKTTAVSPRDGRFSPSAFRFELGGSVPAAVGVSFYACGVSRGGAFDAGPHPRFRRLGLGPKKKVRPAATWTACAYRVNHFIVRKNV